MERERRACDVQQTPVTSGESTIDAPLRFLWEARTRFLDGVAKLIFTGIRRICDDVASKSNFLVDVRMALEGRYLWIFSGFQHVEIGCSIILCQALSSSSGSARMLSMAVGCAESSTHWIWRRALITWQLQAASPGEPRRPKEGSLLVKKAQPMAMA